MNNKNEFVYKTELYWKKIINNDYNQILSTNSKNKLVSRKFLNINISSKQSIKIKEISQNNDLAIYVIFLTLFKITLFKIFGTSDYLISIPQYNIDNNIINKNNMLLFQGIMNENDSFKEALIKEKLRLEETYSFQFYPLNKLYNEYSISEIINFGCVMKNIHHIDQIDNIKNINNSNIVLEIKNNKENIEVNLLNTENCDYYELNVIKNVFIKVITAVLNDSETPIKDIELINNDEKVKLLNHFNNTRVNYNKENLIIDLFEEQVKKNPNNIALVFKKNMLTYIELNEEANKLAKTLRKNGITAEKIVGICLNRSMEMIISILAVLKAGGAYLPLDPDIPQNRINYILKDSNIDILLTDDDKFIKKENCKYKALNILNKKNYDNKTDNLLKITKNDDLAYIIYTSGSTGNPKGVMVEHKQLLNFINAMEKNIALSKYSSILCMTTISFDIFILETLVPLCYGLKIVITENREDIDGDKISQLILEQNIEIVQSTPSRFELLLENKNFFKIIEKIKLLLIGGEQLTSKIVEKIIKTNNLKIYNMYGPTETTIWSLIKKINAIDNITIGTPIINTNAYILDKNNSLLPIGIKGELCISGDGVARGYLNNTNLSSQKFIKNPYHTEYKMYKTGDLAKWTSNGEIEFLGRIDNQVKIGGYRIELEEIENALLEIKGIDKVIVLDKFIKNKKYLCAYYISKVNYSVGELRTELKKILPHYMIPQYFIRLEEIPLLNNGKVNKKNLPDVKMRELKNYGYKSPKTNTEKILASIWAEVLGYDKVSIDEEFFISGGNSMDMIIFHSKINNLYPNKINVTDLFAKSTIEKLASFIEGFHNKTTTIDLKPINNTENKKSINDVEPFNELFYKSCFYTSLIPVVKHYKRSIVPIITNDIQYYGIDKNNNLKIMYYELNPILDTLNDLGINCNFFENIESIISMVKNSISNNRIVILWVDCFYVKKRTDAYKKKHQNHTWVIYGFDDEKKECNIIEHKASDILYYEKMIISYDDVINGYNGYICNKKDEDSSLSYYEFYSNDDFKEETITTYSTSFYLNSYLNSYLSNVELINTGIKNFKEYINILEEIISSKRKFKLFGDQLIQLFNIIVNSKLVEQYRLKLIAWENKTLLTQLDSAINNLNTFRAIIAKMYFGNKFSEEKIEKLLQLLNKILEDEYNYYDISKDVIKKELAGYSKQITLK